MSRVVLQIDGMSCGHCLNAVNQALGGLSGAQIDSVQIGKAEITIDPAVLTSDDLVTAVEDAGYTVTSVDSTG